MVAGNFKPLCYSQLNEGTGRFLDLHQEMRRPFIPTERAALLAREGSEQLGSRNDVVVDGAQDRGTGGARTYRQFPDIQRIQHETIMVSV